MEATKTAAPAAAEQTKKKKKKISPYMVFSTVVIVLLAIAFAFPLYWIITGSFKTQVSINATTPEWFPSEWVGTNYAKLFSRQKAPLWEFAVPFSSHFSEDGKDVIWWAGPRCPPPSAGWSTPVFMAVASMILTCVTSAMAGYALAKKALHRPRRAVHPDRLRHGAAKAGHPHSPAARDEQPEPVQHDLGGHLPDRRLAFRRVPDEAVQRGYPRRDARGCPH